MMVKHIIEQIRQCDDFHNRCDYLLEHDEATYLVEYFEKLEEKCASLKSNQESMYETNKAILEKATTLQQETDRLNNIINELEWKPIEQYKKPKYDWVLVKYFIEPNFECVPRVAEKRLGKWYDINDNLISGEVRYFFDMQQLDKLKAPKEDNNGK